MQGVDASGRLRLRGQMSKPIPVFGFAFSAFAFTHPAFGAGAQGQVERSLSPRIPENPEAERFAAAWRVSPVERRNFTVCVRASQAATAAGFRLLTCAELQLKKFEYVWLHEIEEISEGFAGMAREPRGGLTDLLLQSRISFGLPNITHWAHAPRFFEHQRMAPESAEAKL
jgi:hypothetical protein